MEDLVYVSRYEHGDHGEGNEITPHDESFEDIGSVFQPPTSTTNEDDYVTFDNDQGDGSGVRKEAAPSSASSSNLSTSLSRQDLYGLEFIQNFGDASKISILKDETIKGKVSKTKFRGLIWSVFLKLLGSDKSEWKQEFESKRRLYEKYKKKYCFGKPLETDVNVDNPLSTESNSAWNQYFEDSRLRKTIELDAVRTYPGNRYFNQESVRAIMIDVIFIYAKLYPQMSFRQGMHDIVSAVIVVLKGDYDHFINSCKDDQDFSLSSNPHQTLSKSVIEQLSENLSLLKYIYDRKFIEHDAYFLFEKIMHHLHDSYHIDERPNPYTKEDMIGYGKRPDNLFDHKEQDDYGGTYLARRRLNVMWNKVLAENDKELYTHLKKVEVVPSAFGMNWMKLLYSRQFDNFRFLCMWDIILATDFAVADYVMVAMVMSVRHLIYNKSICDCYHVLVSKYPKEINSQYVMNLALHLWDGIKYSKPIGSSINKKQYASGHGGFSSHSPEQPPHTLSSSSISKVRTSSQSQQLKMNTNFGNSSVSATVKPAKCVELSDYCVVRSDAAMEAEEINNGGCAAGGGGGNFGEVDRLLDHISTWKDRLEFNIDFLVDATKEQNDDERINKIISNFETMKVEMMEVLNGSGSSSSSSSQISNSSSSSSSSTSTRKLFKQRGAFVAQDALDLIQGNHHHHHHRRQQKK